MIEDLKKELTSFKLLAGLLTITVSIYLIQIFWQVIQNFFDIIIVLVIAWLLSFILEPLVDLIRKFTNFSKTSSALIIYIFFGVLFFLMIFIFIPIVSSEFQSLAKLIPQFLSQYPGYLKAWNNAIIKSVDVGIALIPSVATAFIDIIFILFLSFYLIVDKEKINTEIYKLAPKNWHTNLNFIQKVIDSTFSAFLQIQVIFGIIAGITTWLVLTFFGINYGASVSLLAGALTMIPLIGPALALIPPVFIVLATNPNDTTVAFIIFIILLLIQQFVLNFIGPKLMGKAFKLHPAIVFLSIIIGYKIAGGFGAIFAVPFLGILVIVLKELGHYFINPEK